MAPPSIDPATVTTAQMLRIALVRGRRGWRLSASTLGMMVHQAGEAAVPVLIGVVIDQAVVHRDPRALLIWLGVLAAVFVLFSLSYQRAMLGMVRVYGHGEHDLRQLAGARVLDPRGRSERTSTGSVLSVASSDTYRLAGVAWSISEQGATLAALAAASIALLMISVPLGLGVILGAIAVLLGMQALARPLERLGMSEQASVAAASDIATDTLTGLRVVHGLGAWDWALDRYRKASAGSMRGAIASASRLITYDAVSQAVSVLYLGVLTAAAAGMALTGSITVGQLVTVVALAQFLQGSLAHIGTFGANWAHKRASGHRLRDLVADPHALPAGDGSHSGPAVLSWRHGEERIEAEAGRLLGVRVLDSPSARRCSDLLGLRTPPAPGELRLSGRDVLELGPEEYRAHVIAPPHDALVFTGTLRENITGGAGDPVPWRAALIEAAALDDVLDQLGSPDAPVGESGSRLSGGQRQRLLLARALHAEAEIVVLDEPTTALDPLTEHRVAQGLASLGRTIIVVTSSPLLLGACHRVVDLRGTAALEAPDSPHGHADPHRSGVVDEGTTSRAEGIRS